ncbi:hypothetical protein RQP54_16105 [Curvibacter sp. APW13]|uniref:hypothetical protein n=1 Tax=Curvibacter sp. APW13 TaxID=3077236 RepID=UPI0028E02941|nr:hypothetical protein [Curvibacter sp. APW13]MDT8992397.1 hypothetical protein [Curvibacter sp. APW13]
MRCSTKVLQTGCVRQLQAAGRCQRHIVTQAVAAESCGNPVHTYNFPGYRTELRIDFASYMRDRAKDGDLGDVGEAV